MGERTADLEGGPTCRTFVWMRPTPLLCYSPEIGRLTCYCGSLWPLLTHTPEQDTQRPTVAPTWLRQQSPSDTVF